MGDVVMSVLSNGDHIGIDTQSHEHLFDYDDDASEVNKLARLIAEIHHKGKNTYAA